MGVLFQKGYKSRQLPPRLGGSRRLRKSVEEMMSWVGRQNCRVEP